MWFSKKKSPPLPEMKLCEQCNHYFKPGYETTWLNLCQICGKPHRERAAREEVVVRWARQNWEKLEPRALRDKKKDEKARETKRRTMYDQIAQYNRAAQQVSKDVPYFINPYSPLF